MAYSFDYLTGVISVPQSDLTLISGTLYDLDTKVFKETLAAEQASEDGMPFIDMYIHNSEVTVAGTTFARTIEIINGYSVEFTPNSQWTARLINSNNNIFDVENGILVQNQVQVIPTNSAGLIVDPTPETTAQIADAVWDEPLAGHTTDATFGNFVQSKLLTLAKWIGLK